MITFSDDDMVDDIAYIVENDVLLAAVSRKIQELSGNLTVIHEAKIKGYELPRCYRTTDVRVHLDNGSSYVCSLLVSIMCNITEKRKKFQNHCFEKEMEKS
jgi:ubiquinone biosynthesis monooxygenase Coq6